MRPRLAIIGLIIALYSGIILSIDSLVLPRAGIDGLASSVRMLLVVMTAKPSSTANLCRTAPALPRVCVATLTPRVISAHGCGHLGFTARVSAASGGHWHRSLCWPRWAV